MEREAASQRDLIGWMDGDDDVDRFDYGRWTFSACLRTLTNITSMHDCEVDREDRYPC